MNAVDFFDSNILIYLFDNANETKQAAAQRLISQALATDSGCISFQVVQETLNVLTQKFIRPVPLDVANEILRHSLYPCARGERALPLQLL
jgi:predicted nucleic acid-binding protein